ncbi:unnamed protein product, partial [Phaedon cochleariae]
MYNRLIKLLSRTNRFTRSTVNTRLHIVVFRKRDFSDLSYIHNIGKEPLRPLTVGQLLEQTCFDHGNTTAVVSCHQDKRKTYSDILYEADRLAAGLMKMGFVQGESIGLWAPNQIEWYTSFLGCARAGLVVVSLNPAYQRRELEYSINKVALKGIICGHKFRKHNYYEILESICPELNKNTPGHLRMKNMPSLRNIIMISEEKLGGSFNYNEVLNMPGEAEIEMVKKNQQKIGFDNPFNIQLTSGTTGSPKAAVISHFSTVNNGYFAGKRNELHKKHHTICLQNPLFHAYGTIIALSASLNHGSTLVLPSDGFDPEKSLDALREEDCTIIYGTPTMYVDLINIQKRRKEALNVEIALTGGASCSPQLFEDMLQVLKVKKVKSVFGMSETTASSFQSLEDDDKEKSTNTVGYLQEHLEAKVIDREGHIVPIGVPGELCIRGYTTMLGYYKDEEKTKKTIGSDGWLRTGDQFMLREDRYGRILGRYQEMIIRGGENIYPKEIEDFLNTHPDILEAQVIGLPNERLGEEVCACLRTKDGRNFTVQELKGFCKGEIASFKIPTTIHIVEVFPTTATGKIQKNELLQLILNKESNI